MVSKLKVSLNLVQVSPLSFDRCEIMEDPVIASDGITYNRSEIEEWFKKHDTSPKTGEKLKSKGLIPNISIRNAIEEWKKRNSQ